MSGAWKSSEGGTITPIGASSFSAETAGTYTIVAAGVNVRGVRLATISMWPGGGSGHGRLLVNGNLLAVVRYSGNFFAKDLFIPAGVAVTATLDAAAYMAVTYDLY